LTPSLSTTKRVEKGHSFLSNKVQESGGGGREKKRSGKGRKKPRDEPTKHGRDRRWVIKCLGQQKTTVGGRQPFSPTKTQREKKKPAKEIVQANRWEQDDLIWVH